MNAHTEKLLRHVLSRQVWVDIRLLCNILDDLCAGFVISFRLRDANLHNTTLPLSWWLHLVPSFHKLRGKSTGNWWSYIEPLCTLVRRLHEDQVDSECLRCCDKEVSNALSHQTSNTSDLRETFHL